MPGSETKTYDPAMATEKDKVRALIPDKGDGANSHFYLSDEQIDLVYSMAGSLLEAVAQCCEIIATDLGKKAKSQSVSAGSSFSISADMGPKYFLDRAKQMREAAKKQPFYEVSHYDAYMDNYGNTYTEE